MKAKRNSNDVVKALNKANREIAFERNGGGQFVAQTKIYKNKKKYNRKRDKKIQIDLSFLFLYDIYMI